MSTLSASYNFKYNKSESAKSVFFSGYDNNFQNYRYILSLISPKTRNYKKKIDISKNNASNNIINIKKSITKLILNNP